MQLTAERCDECISINSNDNPVTVSWWDCDALLEWERNPTLDEAELFAYRLLAAVKRARGE